MVSALGLVSIALAVGIAVGEWLAVPPAAAALAAGATVVTLIAAARRDRLFGVAALALAAAIGVVAAAGARPRPPSELLDGKRWMLEGVVADTPERTAKGARVPIDLSAV
ncbi:MAG TPA: DUF4131 domain-containing protein, partial [Polyangia bacterium]